MVATVIVIGGDLWRLRVLEVKGVVGRVRACRQLV